MPFKHEVTDSRGQPHKRVSQSRQYHFTIVTFCKDMPRKEGGVWPARSHTNWSQTEGRARNTAKYAHGYWGFESVEIIPCTPIATGKDKVSS